MEAGIALKRKGRPPKDCVVSEQDKVAELKYILACKKSKIIDINSLMTAFEDYVDKALKGSLGMPINYYLKPITKSQLAEMWVDKYFPNKFLKVNTAEGTE